MPRRDQGSSDRSPAVIRAEADLERTRHRLALSVSSLRREVVRVRDWREWVRAKPKLFLALGFGFGLLIGRKR